MKISIRLLIAFLLAQSTVVKAEEILVLRNESMPFCGTIENEDAGMAVEILSKITERGGPKFTYRSAIWPKAQEFVQKNPSSLIIPLTRTHARENQYTWITPLFTHQIRASYRKSKTQPAWSDSPKSIIDIADKKVGVIQGSAFIPRLKELGLTKIVTAKNSDQNARKLHAGRLDFIIESEWVDSYAWKNAGLPAQQMEIAFTIDEPKTIYLAAGLDFPRETSQKIQDIMKQLQADGTLEQILAKWR